MKRAAVRASPKTRKAAPKMMKKKTKRKTPDRTNLAMNHEVKNHVTVLILI